MRFAGSVAEEEGDLMVNGKGSVFVVGGGSIDFIIAWWLLFNTLTHDRR